MDQAQIEIQVIGSLAQIAAKEWDACACPEAADGGRPLDPFTTHRFLLALEQSGSVGRGTGWQPQYLTAYLDGMLIGIAPMYAKSNSQGEYIFDHNWAHAYERAGGRYYPKLQVAVPFTPATGRRFLVRPGYEGIGQSALVQGAVQLATDNQVSSLHITFCTEEEANIGTQLGLMPRTTQQFHWLNDGYADFDGFLGALSSRKRKNIRKERAQANAFGGTVESFSGDTLKPEHWDAFWTFYQDTGARKWGSPYLTRAFFDIAHEVMADDMVMMLAERDGHYVAGALNFVGRETLFGRYWGCIEHHPYLHFELCYYRAIDLAIAEGLQRVEAGAQGEHKLARGYLPTQTHSLHWVGDSGFADAIGRYLQAEREAVNQEIELLTDYGPFKRAQVEEQQ
ncbi:GNAT family N-acetyltransferase [Phaeobacter gallaeciensis]|uniref:GNAT family N-acetyltransferase n=2 Tax=Roseobacteraceae TaxID=2854170 RepID=A0A366X1R5_9RHOB|nr:MULTISPECIES: GNAT family N-acetyltransferase [Roseobacteraceae]MBT3141127.1 GNAT family N-acetyltransferase [Falsiruegeria litorea]RBW54546.1 GNAT family N-acetyltransferase [Phaeobacter gallaeciensis]